jgi:hypothetical protein
MPQIRSLTLVILIVVAAAASGGTVYLLTPRLPGCSPSVPGGTSLVGITRSLPAPTGPAANSTLTLQVSNDSVCPIIFVVIAGGQHSFPDFNALTVMYDGNNVDWNNPLPVGDTAVGSLAVTNVTSGATYQLTAVVVFSQGEEPQIQTFDVTAGTSS